MHLHDIVSRRSNFDKVVELNATIHSSYLNLASYIYFLYLTPLQRTRNLHSRTFASDYCARISADDSEQFREYQ